METAKLLISRILMIAEITLFITVRSYKNQGLQKGVTLLKLHHVKLEPISLYIYIYIYILKLGNLVNLP